MRVCTIFMVLGTLLLSSTALPNPIDAESAIPAVEIVATNAVRAAEEGAETAGSLVKRAPGQLHRRLWGENGAAKRYWAWAKLAYDGNYNQDGDPKQLVGGQGTPWAKLTEGNPNIIIYGHAGPRISASWRGGWSTFTGMRVVVGLDYSASAIVVSFMGTSSLPTIRQDLKFLLVGASSEQIQGGVETGFFECFRSVKDRAFQIATTLADARPDFDIVFTGHSLGGATAQIAANAWAAQHGNYRERTTVFTYGAPRAGTLVFQQQLANQYGPRMGNFRHKNDLFPLVPPIHGSNGVFANAGNRWRYEGRGTWTDERSWRFGRDPDQRTSRRRNIVATTRSLFAGFGQHTQYFSPNAPSRRSLDDDIEQEVVSSDILEKRSDDDSPSDDEMEDADDLINRIVQGGQLNGQQVVFTQSLSDLTQRLHIVGEARQLIDTLNDRRLLTTPTHRVAFLKTLQMVAAEK